MLPVRRGRDTSYSTHSDSGNSQRCGDCNSETWCVNDFGDFYNFDDTVLYESDNGTDTREPQFNVDDFGDFYDFELDELDDGTDTHPDTITVAQATSQLEDGTTHR